ncbi:hypothetical protein [Palaeococcus ferrophilus]|uniref:hypothetical protein n=1 Tax=Palaeococcus ferrophilus TaxID=83868 RepID=UPI00064E3627|nr:hypothetical protein [Palaeococcus ferrophilus]
MGKAVKVVAILLLISFFIGSSLLHLRKSSDGNSDSFTDGINITIVWKGQGRLVGADADRFALLSDPGRLELVEIGIWETLYSVENVEAAETFSNLLAFRKEEVLYYTELSTLAPQSLEAPFKNASLALKLGNLTFFITKKDPTISQGVRAPGNVTIHVCGDSRTSFSFEDGEAKPVIVHTEHGFAVGTEGMEPFYPGKIVFLDPKGNILENYTFEEGIKSISTTEGIVLVATGGAERSGTTIWTGRVYAFQASGIPLWNVSLEQYSQCGYAPAGAFKLSDGKVYTVDYRGIIHIFSDDGRHLKSIETPASEVLKCGGLMREIVADGSGSLLAWAYVEINHDMNESNGLCVYSVEKREVACIPLSLRPTAVKVSGNYVLLSLSTAYGKEEVKAFRVESG